MTETAPPPQANVLQGKKILIVEDDPLLHGLLVGKLKALESSGITLLTAMSYDDALKTAHEAHPDIILLDVVLPGGSGFDLLNSLRSEEDFKNTPVIILSNLNEDTDHERAKQLGVSGYFIKADFPLETIVEQVTNILEKTVTGS